MLVHRLTVPCGALTLEGVLHLPEAAPSAGIVLCHPHPLSGGSMDNNVVMALALTLAAQGMAALRFNFRGVGRSGGRYGEGVAEQEDVRAALDYLASSEWARVPRLGLAGYSFGAGVALAAAGGWPGLAALALISPAARGGAADAVGLGMPKLLLAGDADSFVTPQRLQGLGASLPPPVEVETVPGVDHFWWGAEGTMAQRVARFFVEALGTPPQAC